MARRFSRYFAAAALLVGVLAVLQVAAFRWTRPIRDAPNADGVPARIGGFSMSADGRIAVARITYPGRTKKPFASHLFAHAIDNFQRPQPLNLPPLGVHRSVLSPDGTKLALATVNGRLWMVDMVDRAKPPQQFSATPADLLGDMIWSADGSKILAVSDRAIYAWQYPSAEPLFRVTVDNHASPHLMRAADPDRYWTYDKTHCHLRDLETGEVVRTVTLRPEVKTLAIAKDDSVAVLATSDGLFGWDLRHEQPLWHVPVIIGSWSRLLISISPDGALVASAELERASVADEMVRLRIRRTVDGRLLNGVAPDASSLVGISFSEPALLWTWGSTGNVIAWDIDAQQERLRHKYPQAGPTSSH